MHHPHTTRRTRIESYLASRTPLDHLVATSFAPTWIFDRQTLRILAVNDAALRVYGYSREQFLSLTILDLRPASEVVHLLRHLATHRGRKDHGVWAHLSRSGTAMRVSITADRLSFRGRDLEFVTAIPQASTV